MRALLGPLNRGGHAAVLSDLHGLDVLSFDRSDADVAFDAAREPLTALFERLPAGFTPDCLIWWSPEYTVLPLGIERCPVPSIAVLGDWNLGLWTTAPLLEAFDWVVTDRLGVQQLGPQLEVPVDHWRAFSFNANLHRRPATEARDIDVLFVGNGNHEVQHERAPWMLRLARLAPRRRVYLASGIYGPAYAQLLGRARVVWNRAIRGELNMRAYEAPACGAVLFMETENLEVRDVFADGESCVLYDAESLEARLEEILDAPARAARIAEAGWRRVQRETYRAHLEALLDRAAHLGVGRRPFAELPAWRRDFWLGLHALTAVDPDHIGAALNHLLRASAIADDSGPCLAALGAVSTTAALETPCAESRQGLATAASLFEAAIAAHPEDVISRVSLATTRDALGAKAPAREAWLAAWRALDGDAPFPVDRVPAPFAFDRFRVEWERAAVAPDIGERTARFRALLRARAATALARLEDDPTARAERWSEAVGAFPGVDGNVYGLANALVEAGADAAALQVYRRALELNPMDWRARRAAVKLAAELGDAPTVSALAADGEQLATSLSLESPGALLASQGSR